MITDQKWARDKGSSRNFIPGLTKEAKKQRLK